jgi:hypothetical protein
MAEVIPVEEAKMGPWRDVPTGQLRTTYFLSSPPGSGLPQSFRVENTPHRHLGTHFLEVDQFQVIVRGTGTLGRHVLEPFMVHFSRAFTPYGPIVAGADGVEWLTLRMRRDEGSQHLPERREALLAVKNREPWQVSERLPFEEVADDGKLQPLPAIRDERGLGAFAVRVKAGEELTLPDAKITGGMFLVACRGGLKKGDGETASLATMIVHPHEGAVTVTAGSGGLDALVLTFPIPKFERPIQKAREVAAAHG